MRGQHHQRDLAAAQVRDLNMSSNKDLQCLRFYEHRSLSTQTREKVLAQDLATLNLSHSLSHLDKL
jgi:hypothetical protein